MKLITAAVQQIIRTDLTDPLQKHKHIYHLNITYIPKSVSTNTYLAMVPDDSDDNTIIR